MEIFSAVNAAYNPQLSAKFKRSANIVERTLALYGLQGVAFSFNGGKDSTVLLHLLRAAYAQAEAASSRSTSSGSEAARICTIYFDNPDAFPEVDKFTMEMASKYNLELEVMSLDFKHGLEKLLAEKPIKAVFLGTRCSDPNAGGQEVFAPSSVGWPPFMRVNPIMDWSYHDVWAFLLACKVPYCSLYDHGYTSLGSVHDTLPLEALRTDGSREQEGDEVACNGPANSEDLAANGLPKKPHYRPAYMLRDGRLERAGRIKRKRPKEGEGPAEGAASTSGQEAKIGQQRFASVLLVGDELLRGEVGEGRGWFLLQELRNRGWGVRQLSVVPHDVDSIAASVRLQASQSDLVVVSGGVGPAFCERTMEGLANAFGVRLVRDAELADELAERLQCPSSSSAILKMSEVPEGITQWLPVPGVPYPPVRVDKKVLVLAGALPNLRRQWKGLLEMSDRTGLPVPRQSPFIRHHVEAGLTEIKAAPLLARIASDFPDVEVGYFSKAELGHSSQGSDSIGVVFSLSGKDQGRVQAAHQALSAWVPSSGT